MNNLIVYLLKANLSLVVLYLLYQLFFSRNTFHLGNRIVLLLILFFSVIIPSLEFSFLTSNNTVMVVGEWIEEIDDFSLAWTSQEVLEPSASSFSPSYFIFLAYFIGLGIMFWRFFSQLKSVFKLKKTAVNFNPLENLYTIPKGQLPFTFFRSVFIPQKEYDESNRSYILKHEFAHANQLHTLDIILAELFCIAFWFNPFVFLLKRSLKSVHEYLADEAAAENTNDKVSYLQLLVQGVGNIPSNGISSNFYWLTIKKRINMITKNKTSRFVKFSYLFFIPIIALMVQSFSGISVGAGINLKSELVENNTVPQIKPIAEEDITKISSSFGMRMHPIHKVEKMHIGVDIVANTGTPVVATADGIVVKVEYKEKGKGYGRMVLVQHSDVYATRYTQLSEFKVKEGDKVNMGDAVGLVGSSGISTAPHLHYEVIKNGEHVDPELYFN